MYGGSKKMRDPLEQAFLISIRVVFYNESYLGKANLTEHSPAHRAAHPRWDR
jgi:hypothetical protein